MTSLLPSPFKYREQALLVIPRDFPSVKGSVGDARFVDTLVQSLAEAAKTTRGRMLVLFTSYKMLRQVYDPLKEALPHKRLRCLVKAWKVAAGAS